MEQIVKFIQEANPLERCQKNLLFLSQLYWANITKKMVRLKKRKMIWQTTKDRKQYTLKIENEQQNTWKTNRSK